MPHVERYVVTFYFPSTAKNPFFEAPGLARSRIASDAITIVADRVILNDMDWTLEPGDAGGGGDRIARLVR